jgi:menaquinone-specific isochorismate synthase
MKTHRLEEAANLGEARRVLLGMREPIGDGLRLEVPVPKGPLPLSWLASQPPGDRTYWCERDGRLEIAGVGAALDVAGGLQTAVAQCQPSAPGWRWIGAEAFDPEQECSPEWRSFGSGRFRIPAITWERHEGQLLLCLHVLNNGAGNRTSERRTWGRAHAELSALAIPQAPTSASRHPAPPAASTSPPQHSPDVKEWTALFAEAHTALTVGALNKVVCARRSELEFDEAIDPFALLLNLADSQPGTFRFGIEQRPGHAFIGCTPELLFRREGHQITTEALAGTRRRGDSKEQDVAFALDLVNDEKDRREHDWVVRGLVGALTPYATLEPTGAPVVLRLPHVQHLRTPIAGTLTGGSDADLLSALHPSPAVCGEPVAPAREFIRHKEAFRRGWYAGPVGTVSASGACIAVAIRSALVVGKRLHVYAGAGWVEGSDADREWHEVEAKSRTVLGLIS